MRTTRWRFEVVSAAVVSSMALSMFAGGGGSASAAAAHPEATSESAVRAAGAAGPAEPGGTWGQATNVSGLAALNTGGEAAVTSISCMYPGNCAAGGGYENGATKTGQPFVVSETNGAWGRAREVPGIGNLSSGGSAEKDAGIASVSCGSPGGCAAGGGYDDRAGHIHAYVVSETAGTWSDAITVRGSIVAPDMTSNVTSVSCASAGNCGAVGYYVKGNDPSTRVTDPFVVNETDGTWGTAQPITGFSSLNPIQTIPTSVSCASAGNCSAGGFAQTSSQRHAWVVSETDGTWGTAEEVPGVAGLSVAPVSVTTSVSCPATGDCSAAGYYIGKPAAMAFIDNETNGTWGTAQPVPAPNAGQGMLARSLSCASPANCSISGNYLDTSNNGLQAFVAGEVQGTVGAAQEIPGTATLNVGGYATASSVSCAPTGYCAVGGAYIGAGSSGIHSYVATETGGTWGTAREVAGLPEPKSSADTQLESVSCTATGYCSAGGFYLNRAGKYQAFVVGEATASTTALTVSAAKLVYGNEHAEHLSATVTSPDGGTPTGTVTVTAGTATVCTMTLTAGAGTCTPSATALPAGTYSLTATYNGDTNYAVSRSAESPVAVSKALSATSLALSRATVTYGHETTEHLSVTVVPQYRGTPSGKVTVRAGRATICVITLNKTSKGSCALTARQLKAGTYMLIAAYRGSADFSGSTSAKRALKVVK
jgi:hypothetical protein